MPSCFGAWEGLVRVLLSALRRGQICSPLCELTEPLSDILAEYDVAIPTSEGKLLANVYRSKAAKEKGQKLPVVMCMHPYNNHLTPALGTTPLKGCPQQYRLLPQAGKPRFSKQCSWESPDPNFWVANGYAVVNLNAPGYGGSEGAPYVFTDLQAKAYYEAIEWVAVQDWCSGSVGLNGVSFLAITQYHVAACRAYGGKAPPHLKCISPWEGLSDARADVFMPGGVTEIGFPAFWWATEVKPALTSQDPQKFIDTNGDIPPNFSKQGNSFWLEKAADVHNISVPMLVCGSFSDHGLHTSGSIRAFVQASTTQKWLYTHRTGKWDAYYSPEVQDLTLRFFDYFVKGVDNGFPREVPPGVRLEVRSAKDAVREVRHEPSWPLPSTEYQRLFLGADASLRAEAPGGPPAAALRYSGRGGVLRFAFSFAEAAELTGHYSLHLEVEVEDSPDMAIFAAVQKKTKQGKVVPFRGSTGIEHDAVTRGCLLASYRGLDEAKSRPHLPVLSYERQPVTPGSRMTVHVPMEPSSTFFEAGEGLELIISSKEVVPTGPYVKSLCGNAGTHLVHCGPSCYLVLPSIRK